MAISVAQTKTGTGTTGLTLPVTVTATAAGNSLIVACAEFQSGGASNSVSSVSAGTATFSIVAADQDISGTVIAEVWAADNIPSGITTVTVHYSGANTDTTATVYEVSGLNSAGSVDKFNGGDNDSATSPISWTSNATATLSQASEIAVGVTAQAAAITTITGPSAPWANTALTSGSLKSMAGQNILAATTGIAYSGSSTHTGTANTGTVIGTFKAAGTGVSGTVQPRATVPVPRRRPARALWQRITGQGVAQVPAPVQQPGPAPRRRPRRAWVRFVPVTTTNAVPPPPVAGTVQPQAAVPAPRRRPARAWLRFAPVTTTNAIPSVPGTVQPQTARPAPRRRLLRALVRFTPVATTNAHGASGTVQRRPTVPVPRRQRQRAISRGIAAPFLPVKSPANRQQYQTPPRRRRARALVRFVPVATTNTLGPQTLIISLAAQAGVDDYGNAFPQGILVNQGVIEGSVIASESIPKGTLGSGAVDNFTINAATINAGTVTAADILISGTAGGEFAYSSGGTITQVFASSGTWKAPAGVTSVKVECWGGGGGGSGSPTSTGVSAAGGGGGEYAAEATVAVTAASSYGYTVGAAGAGGPDNSGGGAGGTTTFTGNSVTVTANGGAGGRLSFGIGGAGGTGSTNTTHHSGGKGASVNASNLGGGGGSSGGSLSAGNQGTQSAGESGTGGAAVSDGGPGGDGGYNSDPAGQSPVTGPGGGGGGSAESGVGGGADGWSGQVRITYTSNSPQLVASIAGAATTDPVAGTSVPEGVAADHVSVTSTGLAPGTPSGLCVLYYQGGALWALGPSGVAVKLATT